MAIRTPNWDLFRSFLAVLHHGSLSGAARELALTQPTLGRHIAELEATLGGVALFTRSPQGLLPTETAHDLEPHAVAMASSAAALIRTASGHADEPTGTIRITASEIVGTEVLPAILAAFRRKHPAITVELAPSNRTDDLLRRDADIAVRMVRPTQGALVARSVGRIVAGGHAHPDYIAAHGLPRTLHDLAGHTLIGFDRSPYEAGLLAAVGGPINRDSFALRTDSDLVQLAATRAGYGIGFCQLQLARRPPVLVPILHDKLLFPLDVWITMHEDLRASRRMRLMFDHLAEGMAAYVAEV